VSLSSFLSFSLFCLFVLFHFSTSYPSLDSRASCLIYSQALIEYLILYLLLIVWVRSFSKMLPYIKFAEDKVLVFVILREKCEHSATVSLTLIVTIIPQQIDKLNRSGIIERRIVVKYIWFSERTYANDNATT